VPPGSRIRAARFLRCANGANIELFEFSSPEQREDFPRPSDVGIQHLALYIENLDAAAKHLHRHGVHLLSEPNPLPGPEAGEGNRFIYARTPWGLSVELISYPAPMAYERRSGKTSVDATSHPSVAAQYDRRRQHPCAVAAGYTASS
jgi:hypothetical protein